MSVHKSFLFNYQRSLNNLRIGLPVILYFLIAVILSLAIAFGVGISFKVFSITVPSILKDVLLFAEIVSPLVVFAVLLDLFIGFPVYKEQKRIDEIEENLAPALKQLSDTLKTGSTYEAGFQEIAESNYGLLSIELNKVLDKLREGENFENSMKTLSENVNSRLVDRTVTIIIDSVKSGGGLADVLESISGDVREAKRVDAERRARTLMQTLFIFVAGALIAPFIFGIVSTIIQFLIQSSISTGVVSTAAKNAAENARFFIVLLLQFYIFVSIFATSIMIALMRKGKINKSVLYFPVLLFIAFLVFYASIIGSTLMLIGG